MTSQTVTSRLTKKEAAEYLRIGVRQLQRLMGQGRIGYTRVHSPKGDVALFEESELERFAEERSKQVYVPTRPAGASDFSRVVIPSQDVSLALRSDLATVFAEAIAKAGADALAQLRTAKPEPTLVELAEKAWLTRREAIRLSGLPSKIIYQALVTGALGVKFNGRWIIRRTELEKFAAQWSPRRAKRR